MGDKLLTPNELKAITDKVHMAKVQEQFDRERKDKDERRTLHDDVTARDLHPEVNGAIKRVAEQGLHDTQSFTFPAGYCNDQGRRINNAEPDCPDFLEGFAKTAHALFEAELKPLGFGSRAHILNYPDGRPGDVGMFLNS
jgi:hypothetical protein